MCVCVGNEREVEEHRKMMNNLFDYDDVGEITEYVGCKVERTNEAVKLTQPVLL